MIDVQALVKDYPGGVRAVDGISFHVDEGEVFGFLGPNGAGKTTTIRVIVTLLSASQGRVTVDGLDVTTNPEEVRRRIGYAAQFIGIDNDLTAHENLVLQGQLHGLGAIAAHKRAGEMLELMDLNQAASRRAGTFSGGMRRRLDLAQALVHSPRLLVLDEPTTGLDPQTRRALWGYLRELNQSGVTIFLTTQYLEEADQLAHRLAIIDQGHLVAAGSPEELKAAVGGDAITVTLAPTADEVQVERARNLLAEVSLHDVKVSDHALSLFVRDGSTVLAELVRRLDSAHVPVAKLELAEPTLDEVFLRHTGARMRVEEVAMPARTAFSRRRG